MIKWLDNAILLGVHQLSPKKNRLIFLTQNHGKVAVAVYKSAQQIIGNIFQIDYSARLHEHLGTAKCEIIHDYGARIILDNAESLHILLSASGMVNKFLPEFAIYREIYEDFSNLLAKNQSVFANQMLRYCLFELRLLQYLGYGLDLTKSAISGRNDGLAFVSPKSGRAVSYQEGLPYQDKLLQLPSFMVNENEIANKADIYQSLILTGYFLKKNLADILGVNLPDSRNYLVALYADLPNKIANQ